MKLRRFDHSSPDFRASFQRFLVTRRQERDPAIDRTVAVIVADVIARGGEAVVELTQKFDRIGIDPQTLKSDAVDIALLARDCPADVRTAIDAAADRIAAYHEKQRPTDGAYDDGAGVALSWRWTPLDAVGLYVPGGRASYPSSVLMNAIPARLAGVSRLVMTSPATGGEMNPAVAYAAVRSGVDEFYPIGGAQAVAALAYGAGSLAPVDKIVGPGNAYVTAAKRMVFGTVGIDTIAGPSELTIVADSGNDPAWVAADLLSQAEHDPLSQSILITDDPVFAAAVETAIDLHLQGLATASTARQALAEQGAVVICDMSQAAAVVDLIAPEHLEISTRQAEEIAAGVRHAGAIFVGPWACEALGDYATGSNHVLPTSGVARFASGLSTVDFMKRTSVQRISKAGFDALAGTVETLARAEGLPAHALSVSLRRGGQ